MKQRPIRLVQFVRAFHLGGTESQVVELLRALPSRYQVEVGVLDEEGPLLEDVWKMGHVPAGFPLGGSAMSPTAALQIGRLAAWLTRMQTELLHVHDFYSTLVAVPAAKLARCKVVVGRLDLAHWQGKVRRAVLAGLTRWADHTIVNAKAIRQQLISEERMPEARITVIPNGLDLPRFDRRRALPLERPVPDVGGAPVVVHVANLNHPVKRQEDVIAAVGMLNAAGIPLHAYLVGDGPRRQELQQQVRDRGLEKKIHFLGHRTDVPAVYARGTFGVLCSTAEGTSNALMEGMASGLAMVVTPAGGSPDLISDGVSGWIVPACAPTELAGAFRRLLEDPERARAMGQRARDFVERELSVECLVSRHDALYQQMLGGLSVAAPVFN